VKTVLLSLALVPLLLTSICAQNSEGILRQRLTEPLPTTGTEIRSVTSDPVAPAKKSQLTSIVYSLLLPGMGELYAGDFGNGRYFLGTEAALWLGYASYRQYGSWVQADSRAYASVHSGASVGGKDDQFFVNVSNFQDIYQYNDKKLQDRNPAAVYDPALGYYWSWDTDADRQHFRALRVSGAKIIDNSRFVIAAVVVNHIISAINAARLVRHYNKSLEQATGGWWIEPDLVGANGKVDGLALTLTRRF